MDTKQQFNQPYYPPNEYPGAPPVYIKPIPVDPIELLPAYIKWPIKIGIVLLALIAAVNSIISCFIEV